MTVIIRKRPDYFESITHPVRWVDPYASPSGEERLVLTPEEIEERGTRNDQYMAWQRAHGVPQPRKPIFQVIQVLRTKHDLGDDAKKNPWWDEFQDCLFRVFVNPLYQYDERSRNHHGWYILCPEDCYLVNRYRLEKTNPGQVHLRTAREKYFSSDKRLRKLLAVPVQCCRHWRHETTAGELPAGL